VRPADPERTSFSRTLRRSSTGAEAKLWRVDSLHDVIRDTYLRNQGYHVLRFWNADLAGSLDPVLTTIYAALSEPAPHPAR
jgi:very-short-patch-repair endonuclease